MADIEYIPKRINQMPVIYNGMTEREIMLIALIGFVASLPVGIISALVMGAIAMVPTCAFVGSGLFVVLGGRIMRRLRRGRSPNLLYRSLQFRLAKKGYQTYGENLITESSVYCVKRDNVRTQRGEK